MATSVMSVAPPSNSNSTIGAGVAGALAGGKVVLRVGAGVGVGAGTGAAVGTGVGAVATGRVGGAAVAGAGAARATVGVGAAAGVGAGAADGAAAGDGGIAAVGALVGGPATAGTSTTGAKGVTAFGGSTAGGAETTRGAAGTAAVTFTTHWRAARGRCRVGESQHRYRGLRYELGRQQFLLLTRGELERGGAKRVRESRDAAGVAIQSGHRTRREDVIEVPARASDLMPQIILELRFRERRELGTQTNTLSQRFQHRRGEVLVDSGVTEQHDVGAEVARGVRCR